MHWAKSFDHDLLQSVIIRDLYVKGVAALEPEAQPPLIVDPDTPLSLAVTFEPFQSIGWGQPKVLDSRGRVDLHQSHKGPRLDIRRESARTLPTE
jgi:hypothetical protein